MDPPENAHINIKLMRHRILIGDAKVAEADAVVNLKDCMTSWKPLPVKIGAMGTINLKVYFHPAVRDLPQLIRAKHPGSVD